MTADGRLGYITHREVSPFLSIPKAAKPMGSHSGSSKSFTVIHRHSFIVHNVE